jgi:hypothetical protein
MKNWTNIIFVLDQHVQYYKFMEDSNMKKVLSILFSASLILGITTSAFASENSVNSQDVNKGYEIIKKTNDKINEKIAKAQYEAGKLFEEYLAAVEKLDNEKGEAVRADSTILSSDQKVEFDKVAIEDIVLTIEQELFKKISSEEVSDNHVSVDGSETNSNKLLLALNGNTNYEILSETDPNSQLHWEYQDLTDKYLKKLEKIITNVFNQTKKMSDQTIKRVQKYDIVAECDWVSVKFGHRYVDIDPIRVVGG